MDKEIRSFFEGDVLSDDDTLDKYSHDASLCEVRPKLVLFPKNTGDIKKLVKFVGQKKQDDPALSITVRSAGTCMAGGPLNESIIIDVTKYLNGVLEVTQNSATVLPGTFYRDFEKETLKRNLILPCYPASKNICAIGGMIGNNGAGEKTLQYGKMEDYILELSVIFADGEEYTVKPLSKDELEKKINQDDFEGNIYKQIWELIKTNNDAILKAKPDVSKNSAGYYIWNVWDGKTFDLTKLIVGSQGTLGIVTKAKLRLVPVKRKSRLFVIFLPNLTNISKLVNEILPLKPESLESYDDKTLKLAIRFFPEMLRSMKVKNFFKLIFSFIPETLMIFTGGLPKLIILVEFSDNEESIIDQKIKSLESTISHFRFKTHQVKSEWESQKYWTIRRESFNLLRKHIHGKRTAPFVDDVIVKPEYLPEFLPRMKKILDDFSLVYTIAGHAGNGNFHIIPLMDMKDRKNIEVIMQVSDKIYDLVALYRGSITAEHNDGIIRTPYLSKIYSPQILSIFKNIKNIFDFGNIFNPGKKVQGSLEYMKSHLVRK